MKLSGNSIFSCLWKHILYFFQGEGHCLNHSSNVSLPNSLRKKPFYDVATEFPAKWRFRNECRNSILMTHHYPDLGSLWTGSLFGEKNSKEREGKGRGGAFPLPSSPLDQRPVHRLDLGSASDWLKEIPSTNKKHCPYLGSDSSSWSLDFPRSFRELHCTSNNKTLANAWSKYSPNLLSVFLKC